MVSSGVTIYIPYDSTQFDYYLKLSISIISIQLSKILMFFFNSYNMIHNVDNIQPETLNLRIHCTIVTGTLLIYNKDAIKKNAIFLVFFFLDLEHSHISKKNWLVYMFTTQAWPLSRHKVTCRRENSLAHQWYSRDTSLGQLWQNRVFELICFPPRQWIRVKWHGFFNFVTGQLWLNYLKQWLPRNKLSYENIPKKIIQGRFPFLI